MSNRTTREWVASIMPGNQWTEVAHRVRHFPCDQEQPDWEPTPGAPISLEQAIEFERSGLIFRALTFRPREVAVVVLPRREPPPPKKTLSVAAARRPA
jgi:hypothetical protein